MTVSTISPVRAVSGQTIQQIVSQIAQGFRPLRVILFGSRASGKDDVTSDVDLLVVMDTDLRETEQAVQICQAIDYGIDLDLIVRKPSTIERRLALGDPFIAEILRSGQVLYESADG